jgi:NADPH-dependent curcumin reductase
MAQMKNRRIVLAARPAGEPADTDFRLEETDIPSPGDGQVLLRTLYLSLDPYMRGRMNAGPSYAPPVQIGEVMEGATVSEVVESKSTQWRPGDVVRSYTGWQAHALAEGSGLERIDPNMAPVSTALGVLGTRRRRVRLGLAGSSGRVRNTGTSKTCSKLAPGTSAATRSRQITWRSGAASSHA